MQIVGLHALPSDTFPNFGILDFVVFVDAVGMYEKKHKLPFEAETI